MTREGGSLKLANVTKKLQDLLSITKLLTVFETFDSEDEAAAELQDGKSGLRSSPTPGLDPRPQFRKPSTIS